MRRRRRLLLPLPAGDGPPDDEPDETDEASVDEARAEYASVASFAELSLRLIAVGAPAELVAACHRAALDEIRHADTVESLAGRHHTAFGPIPALLGRRIGGRATLLRWRSKRSRHMELRRLAVESYVDGWLNEGQAAAQLRARAANATSPEAQQALATMADDEQRHADLAREIVTWCFEQDPAGVGRALTSVALPAAA